MILLVRVQWSDAGGGRARHLALPLTDGLLLLRYAFGFRGPTLIANALGEDCSRCDAPSIQEFIEDNL